MAHLFTDNFDYVVSALGNFMELSVSLKFVQLSIESIKSVVEKENLSKFFIDDMPLEKPKGGLIAHYNYAKDSAIHIRGAMEPIWNIINSHHFEDANQMSFSLECLIRDFAIGLSIPVFMR